MRIPIWLLAAATCLAQSTETLYLSGLDKDHSVNWDFFCTHGRNSGRWSQIAVPSNWELQGFGHYNFGRDKVLSDEQGLYRHSFSVPSHWKGKKVFLVFEGSMTDTEVKINGRLAGPVHQGGFYQFRYDVTSLLHYGSKNTLAATVAKMSSNASVNEAERTADYWVFGGIFRPVYLQALPAEYIDRVAIDARADGTFKIQVFAQSKGADRSITVQVQYAGKPLPQTWSTTVSQPVIEGKLDGARLWSAEFPHLYTAVIHLQERQTLLHSITEKFGFRTIEVNEHDGIYVNGNKIMFRGVCRHCFWPESGRCLSQALSIQDVNLIKDMNMNAVRMSHYPPDVHFLDACDSLGLFVIDELAGWQYPPYDSQVGKKLVEELVVRDVNHPSILLWANGNEGGFNYELLREYGKYDPQQRTVIHPWEKINGLDTFHYFPYDYGIASVNHGMDVFFPTEILHGLYDGGVGAGLDDYWNLMRSNPLSAGAFLWVLTDEGVLRRDHNDSMDTRGNMGPDGIVGPFREKEASFYTIKDIWSPIQFEKKIITAKFNGTLQVHNRFDETNLQQCRFECEWIRFNGTFPQIVKHSARTPVSVADIAPQTSGALQISLPPDWQEYDLLFLSGFDPYGRHINSWSWNLTTPQEWSKDAISAGTTPVSGVDDGQEITLSSGGVTVSFSKQSGQLSRVLKNGRAILLHHGPVFTGFEPVYKNLQLLNNGSEYAVEWIFAEKPDCHMTWRMQPGGICCFEYDYRPDAGAYTLLGLSFAFPESLVTGARLLANGPYRVWKNRLRGPLFGLYDKKYNNTVTGESWDYPEFKGYYSNFYAVALHSTLSSFSILSASEDLYLHLFTPDKPKGAVNLQTVPPFPAGDLSFMHAISAIGNKSHPAELTGPQGGKSLFQPNRNTKNLSGKLYFIF